MGIQLTQINKFKFDTNDVMLDLNRNRWHRVEINNMLDENGLL